MATNGAQNIATGAAGTILRGNGVGSVPTFTTSTYPATNAISTLLYASAGNVMSALATANNGILNTSGTGVPSITITPTIGTTALAASLTVASNTATAFAMSNGVAHGTIPVIDLYHNAATVATDYAYEIDFNAQNSTPAKKTFASIQGEVLVNTATSEMGQFIVNTINAGSSQTNITVGNNIGQYRGTQGNTVPPSGFIGEQISSIILQASAVSLVDSTAKTITSISLTPGIWDITLCAAISASVATTQVIGNISTTTNTLTGNEGDAFMSTSAPANSISQSCISVPAFRVTLAATTTYYYVARSKFASGTSTAWGRISAVRVG